MKMRVKVPYSHFGASFKVHWSDSCAPRAAGTTNLLGGSEGEVPGDWGGYEPGVGVTVSEPAVGAETPAVGGSSGGAPAGVVPAGGYRREGGVPGDGGGYGRAVGVT